MQQKTRIQFSILNFYVETSDTYHFCTRDVFNA